jgi:hypothetical protein
VSLKIVDLLLPLSIEKGKDFKPDAGTVAQLNSVAAQAHAWLLAQVPTFVIDWWPNSQWKLPSSPIGPKTGFNWTVANYFDVDSRGIAFSTFFVAPAKLGAGSFYLGANFDSSGQPLRGENTYRLHVPANVPVSQFWAVTVYNSETSALFLNQTRPTLDSLDKEMRKNADGSVDIYFGPKAPDGQESNWLQTPAEKSWFPSFRFYGPQKPLFDKSWKMPDIEMVKQLDSCDQETPLGRRNYAILLLLSRLGLRAAEIVGLNLEDIDWDNARITVWGKGSNEHSCRCRPM